MRGIMYVEFGFRRCAFSLGMFLKCGGGRGLCGIENKADCKRSWKNSF